jgi:anti-sigma regulatory factor (Ser/Thr protein kinase)
MLHSRLDLASSPSAVRFGRAHATDVLGKWGVPEAGAGNAVLIVSELLTNAVQHVERPTSALGCPVPLRCCLVLFFTERGLTVSVYDTDDRPPLPRYSTPADTRGRGLLLVEKISDRWGYTPTQGGGKLVWARLAVPFPAEVPDAQRNLWFSAGQAVSAGAT